MLFFQTIKRVLYFLPYHLSLLCGVGTRECLFPSTHLAPPPVPILLCPAPGHPGCSLLAGHQLENRRGGQGNSSQFLPLLEPFPLSAPSCIQDDSSYRAAPAPPFWLTLASGITVPSPHLSHLRSARAAHTEHFTFSFIPLTPPVPLYGPIWG